MSTNVFKSKPRVEANIQPHPGLSGSPLQSAVHTAAPFASPMVTRSPAPSSVAPAAEITPAEHTGGVDKNNTPPPPSQGTTTAEVYMGVCDEQGGRNHMEDRHTLIDHFIIPNSETDNTRFPRQFMAVYDGHACFKGSEHASKRLHEILQGHDVLKKCKGDVSDKNEVAAMEQALKQAFENMDREMLQRAVSKGRHYGSTAVVALRVGGALYVAHAGDSAAVLCRDDKVIALTRSHKPTDKEERERIEAHGGQINVKQDRVYSNPESDYASALNMSRALGDPAHKIPRKLVEAEPDVAHFALQRGHDKFLVLGSDGLFDVMKDGDVAGVVVKVLKDAKDINEVTAMAAADALVEEALRRKTRDNVTAAVMLFKW